MPNAWFQFKQFTVCQDRCAMKVTTDSCLFGSWAAAEIRMQTYEKERAFLLDIGTGTGLLSLMIAQQNDLSIDAVEIEMAAAMQARENIDRSPWKDRIRIQKDDITV